MSLGEASDAGLLRQRIGAGLGILCGAAMAAASWQLPLGNARLIGPGAVPLVLSFAMAGLSVVLLLRPPAAAQEDEEEGGGLHGALMVGLVAVLIGIYGVVLTRLGFLTSTTALMYAFYAIGEERAFSIRSLILAIATSVGAYLLFVVALSVNLPAGTLWGY